MTVKCACSWCGNNIEFDAEHSGEDIDCPHCGKRTGLFIPKAQRRHQSRLTICNDCGSEMSRNADACPKCGARTRAPKTVFFYVFWGVVSLVATIFIIAAALLFGGAALSGFVSGVTSGVKPKEVAEPSKTPLSDDEKREAEKVISEIEMTVDDFRGVEFYQYTTGASGNYLKLYVSKLRGSGPSLRLRAKYYGEDWIFMESVLLKVGGKRFEIRPDGDVERDNSSGSVWEWFDEPAGKFKDAVNAMASESLVQAKFSGSRGEKETTLTSTELEHMRKTILLYRYFGGAW